MCKREVERGGKRDRVRGREGGEGESEGERGREGGERGWGGRNYPVVRRQLGEWEAFESFLLSRSSDTTDVNIGTPDYSWERKRRRKRRRRSRKRRRGSRKK